MNKETFTNRVIQLTSEKISLEHEYNELKQQFKAGGFASGSNKRLKYKIKNTQYAIDHVEFNIKINAYMASKV